MNAEEEVPLQCVLHITGDTKHDSGGVIPFTKQTWKTAGSIAQARKQYQQRSKYIAICDSINFSDEPLVHYGSHSRCYSKFTSYHIHSKAREDIADVFAVETRSMAEKSQVIAKTSIGILEEKCIFCKTSGRKHFTTGFQTISICENVKAQTSVINAAKQLNDQEFLGKYEHIDFLANNVKYHKTCRARYICRGALLVIGANSSTYASKRQSAFVRLLSYIDSEIFVKEVSKTLMDINKVYNEFLREEGFTEATSDPYHLLSKIKRHYGEKIYIDIGNTKQGISICTAYNTMSIDLRNVALHLRKTIRTLTKRKLPTPITVDAIHTGQCVNIPSELTDFYRILYTGSKEESKPRVERFVMSAAEDDIYKTTRGKVKPSKHMLLGMGLKSITGSKKVQELASHFGHCIGYYAAEEYETQIAAEIIAKNRILPDGLVPREGLSTNLAWDNYDESMYHDTQGICIQNEVTESPPNVTMTGSASMEVLPNPTTETQHAALQNPIFVCKIRKRSLEIQNAELEPVRNKPKISQFSFDKQTMDKPANHASCLARDITWTVCCKTNNQTPMWSGFNSNITRDNLPSQKIGYLANIGAPPTRHDVVNETMKRSVVVAKECNEKYIATTYDLAIAKPASQLQDIMTPKFDSVFVCFGAFHIMFRYLSAVGYIIDGTGAAHILMESGALMKGSLNAFISGTHFNQSRRMHILLASAMRSKHIDLGVKLVQEAADSYRNLVDILPTVHASPSPESMADLERSDEYGVFIKAYERFSDDTRTGKHGVNAQFWMLYIDIVNLYMMFSRAVRTNDVNLFIFVLGDMIDIFFAANRHNYARYMCLYYLKLLNMDTTHPGIRKQLEEGALSVRLSSNSFARQPVDQALETTINADAASRKTGITAFHQSKGATMRWTVTRSARSSIVRHLFEKAGIMKDTNPSHELRKPKVDKFQRDSENISNMIESTMNPFSETLVEDTNLYCLADGKEMSDEIKEDMLNVFVLGKKWKDEFKDECLKDSTRFERPIKRRKVRNFASAAVKSKVRGKDEKVVELKTTRDLMGRLVYLACTRKINLEKVFPFPLTPVPLSLASIYGTIKKTPKYKLCKYLEGLITHDDPKKIDTVLYDAMFVVQSLPADLPLNFGGIAIVVLRMICNTEANEVHFVCDSYVKSIKNIEQQTRGVNEASYHISGADQLRPKDFRHALRSPQFKTALIKFFMEEWKKDAYAIIMKQKTVIVAHEDQCQRYTPVMSQYVEHNEAPEYICSHIEADTRLIYHLSILSTEVPDQNVVVRATDTDILVNLLYHSAKCKADIWMELGHSSDNSRRHLHINKLAHNLGPILCKALPGYHALTGSDYTSPFYRKGKVNPLKKAQKNALYMEGLGNVGECINFSDDSRLVEKYICSLYGYGKLSSVNDVRLKMFMEKYKPKDPDSPLDKIKGIDAGMLPPCRNVLVQKLARCNYVSYLWKKAHLPNPVEEINPTDHGWQEKNGILTPVWFTGCQMPSVLTENIVSGDVEDDDDDDDDENDISTDSDDESSDDCGEN